MDGTDFDDDDQTALVFSLVAKHGRATPLLWRSLFKAELTGKRNDIEDMRLRKTCASAGSSRRCPTGRT